MRKDFCYVYSSELDIPIRVRIVSLMGVLPRLCRSSNCMFLKILVDCNGRWAGREVFLPSNQTNSCVNNIQTWNEWCVLPICYSELSRDAVLHISLWDVGESIQPEFIAQCSKKLFSKHEIFRTGQLDLRMEYSEGWHNYDSNPFEVPNKNQESFRTTKKKKSAADNDLNNLLKKEKLFEQNFIDHVNWLDKITFSRLEVIKHEAKIMENALYLTIEMPSVFYNDDSLPYVIMFSADNDEILLNNTSCTTTTNSHSITQPISPPHGGGMYWTDPELGLENLCEIKHHMLTRNARANDIDRRLQPNPTIRDALDGIIKSPSCQEMSVEERDLIWKFRFWLKSNPHALTKFVRSVNWDEELEVEQAIQAILEWEPIDACDALELLAPTFTHPFVRRYAVSRLQRTTYANILLYLPQLVQALRYETKVNGGGDEADMLIVTKDMASTNMTGSETTTTKTSLSTSNTSTTNNNNNTVMDTSNSRTKTFEIPMDITNSASTLAAEYFGPDMDLASFLIRAACENSVIANFFYWYLKVEVEANEKIDEKVSKMFGGMMDRLRDSLSKGNSTARQTLATLSQQKKFVDTLVEMAKLTAEVSGSRVKKLEILKKKLSENHDFMDLKGLSLPLDPSIHVKSIQADSTLLFSSNLMPMRLTFSTVRGSITPYECGEAYTTIFKRGDDLRQDQLVIQMIRLMDSLLKEEKLDLCLTPYAVLATSVTEGFVQFVKATPIADLKSIQSTLRTFRPSSSGPYGIEADVLNNYVRSCSGYSIICYILGVGDRHLHNLLLCENGRMFHVDFGFILGRDPKPMPPDMKLTSEMINAMGGQNSEYFKKFVDYCTTAFCILRRHANLITNLFSLMLDAGIPDIAVEKDKAVQKVLERFHLNLTDEGSCQLINRIIESSLSAKMPLLVDFVHEVKQFISN